MNTGPSLDDSLRSLAQMKKEYPSPPPMHWFGVLLASAVVGGLGEWLSRHTGLPFLRSLLSSEVVLYLWLCVQSAFVQRLEPESHSLTATLLGGASIAAGYGLSVMGNGSSMPWKGIAVLLVLIGPLLLLCDLFRMRRTLERHYNDIEPYGLLLINLWLLLFGPLYLQYHFHRIALWKDRQAAERSASQPAV